MGERDYANCQIHAKPCGLLLAASFAAQKPVLKTVPPCSMGLRAVFGAFLKAAAHGAIRRAGCAVCRSQTHTTRPDRGSGFAAVDLPLHHRISGEADAAQRNQSGLSLPDSGQCAQAVESAATPPPCEALLTFSFTESQRDRLAFACLCEAEDLADGHEADEPEVQEAIRDLWEARRILIGGAL
ncbi:MAG: hypothetical protein WBM09_13490 [Gallionella sp.]